MSLVALALRNCRRRRGPAFVSFVASVSEMRVLRLCQGSCVRVQRCDVSLGARSIGCEWSGVVWYGVAGPLTPGLVDILVCYHASSLGGTSARGDCGSRDGRRK